MRILSKVVTPEIERFAYKSMKIPGMMYPQTYLHRNAEFLVEYLGPTTPLFSNGIDAPVKM